MPRPSTRPDARRAGTGPNIIETNAVWDWITLRKETLLDKVSAHDVLRYFGVSLRFSGSEQREQIPCPFHDDNHPSARVFPTEGSSPSALYCFTCFGGKRKNIFELWKAFKGDPEMKFTLVLRGLEEAFGMETPEPPSRLNDAYEVSSRGPSEEDLEVQRLLEVCELRLRDAKPNFKMEGFLIVGQCLDRLHYRIGKGTIKLAEAKVIIRKVLDKISEKMRVAGA